MDSCCKNNYNKQFDHKVAAEELKDYQNNQIKKNSQPLINELKKLPLEGLTLLDIGGGIGMISFELLKLGLRRSHSIELSESYADTFQQEVERRGLTEKVEIMKGDFIEMHQQIGEADLVTLDKVICCYSNYTDLVKNSASKSRMWYAYTIPRDTWWVKRFHFLSEGIKRILGNPFLTFVHPAEEIEKMVLSQGFKKRFQHQRREWLYVVFERS